MKIAVVGATGLVGRHAVAALVEAGHQAIAISRSSGIDVVTGQGLDHALDGVDAVIDVVNSPATDLVEAERFFAAATDNLLDAERRAGTMHHVLLSIVGIHRVIGNAHYVGKRRQEALVEASSVPHTIVSATQFYEFAEMVVGWTRQDDAALIAPILIAPVAARDVGRTLAEIAAGPPLARIELAGPDRHDFVDMTRRVLTARGDLTRLVPGWHHGLFGLEMAGDVLLPAEDARIAPTTFEQWLAGEGTAAPG